MGQIGRDPAGSAVIDDLKKDKVSTELVAYSDNHSTGYSVLLLAPDGGRTILTYRGASTHYELNNFKLESAHADWFYLSTLSGNMDVLKKIIHFADDRHIKVAFNPGKKELSQPDKLKELLVEPGHIDVADFERATKEAEKKKVPIERLIVEGGLMKDENYGRAIADGFDYHFVDLKNEKIDESILHLIPELVARSKGVIAISREKDGVKVGMRNLDDVETRHVVEKRLGENIIPYFITEKGLESALLQYKTGLREEFDRVQSCRFDHLRRCHRY